MDPTVREFLPWHVVASKLGLPDSGVGQVADDMEEAPVSGVQGQGDGSVKTDEGDLPLTYKVYTLADLDRRDSESPVSASIGRDESETPPSKITIEAWAQVGRSFVVLVKTLKAWATLKNGRPAFADATRAPRVVLQSELRNAVRAVGWKKVGVALGGGFAIVAVLLFAVLTVADLTDDMRATSASQMAKTMAAPPVVEAPVLPAAPAPIVIAPPQAAAPVEEIDTPAPAPVKKGKKAKKAPAPPKADDGEVFIP